MLSVYFAFRIFDVCLAMLVAYFGFAICRDFVVVFAGFGVIVVCDGCWLVSCLYLFRFAVLLWFWVVWWFLFCVAVAVFFSTWLLLFGQFVSV